MGSLENGSLPKRDPLLRHSLRPYTHHGRPYRSKLVRFLFMEKVDYLQWLGTAAFFFFVILLFESFLPGSVPEIPVSTVPGPDRGKARQIAGLDFGDGIRFEPFKLLESWERERREEQERLNKLERQVVRFGVRKPKLAMVFGDLLPDEIQLQMVSLSVALKAAGYEIEVFSFEYGPAYTIWNTIDVPVYNLSINTEEYKSIDWLDYNGILINSLESKPVFSSLLQEPFKSIPVIWTIHEPHLANRLSHYYTNGSTQLINTWNQAFNRATVVVFPNYVLPLMYSVFDGGNFYVIPGTPAQVLRADRHFAVQNDCDLRKNYGFDPEDFIIAIVGSQFSYSGMLIEQTLVLESLIPLLSKFLSQNGSNSRLKIRILSGNSTNSYKTTIETIAGNVGFPRGIVDNLYMNEEMENLLSISDIVIYGSFIEEQAFPSILVQAMSLKKLVIAPDLTMIRKYVENGVNGYLFPKEKISTLTQIILQITSDGKLSLYAQRIASIARAHTRNLMSAENIEGYFFLLENIIKFPSEFVKPKTGKEISSDLKEQWQWGLFENLTAFNYSDIIFNKSKVLQKIEDLVKGQSVNNGTYRVDDGFSAIAWDEEKKIEMANIRRRIEEEELKERSEQQHGTWEEVYRNVKRADRAKNELHERDDKELERTGQPLCIYEPYFGEGSWNFLHQSSLYRGIGLSTKGRRPGNDDIDASSRLPLLNNVYYRDLLGDFGAFFAVANRIDRIHKNAWIGFQSWRASAQQGKLSKDAESEIVEAVQAHRHGDALYFWVRMDQDPRKNKSSLENDFWSFCDSINAGNCRFAIAKAMRRMYGIKTDRDCLPPMPNNGETWSVMQSWVLPTRSFLEFVMFSRMFVDALDADMYEEHHGTGHCYLSVHKDPYCYSRILELLINVWAYHSARRMVYVNPHKGSMQELHRLRDRRGQMWIQWFSFSTLKSMDEDLAEETDLDSELGRPIKRWIWPDTGEVFWQGVYERERNMRQQQKEKRKQQSKDKIQRIKKRARQKTLGKYVKPPLEEGTVGDLNSTRTS